MNTLVNDFLARLPYEGDLKTLIIEILNAYGFNEVGDYKIVTSGFEDCNFIVETEKGKVFVKCYAKMRAAEQITRNILILETIDKNSINHPKLYRTAGNKLLFSKDNVHAVVMDFIDGQSFYELGRTPSDAELKLVIAEAVKINNLDIKPPFIYDSIAITNFLDMYHRVASYMSKNDLSLVESVTQVFEQLKLNELPKAFVHDDLISTNLILDRNNKVWVLDFSVANIYPRAQELAVIASSLLYSKSGNSISLKERTDKVARYYEDAGGELRTDEHRALYPMALAAQAMELMGGYQYIFINRDNTKEAKHWQEIGRKGLKAELGVK